MAEFCGAHPDRLKGIAVINLDDVEEGVKELKRAKRLGLAGAMIPVYPQEDGRQYRNPDYEPLWATAEELDIPLSLHIGTTRPSRAAGQFARFSEAGKREAEVEIANTDLPVRMSLAAMIFSGVFERYSGLKVLSVENGLAWIPWFVSQMDYLYRERQEQTIYRFKNGMIPSDFDTPQRLLQCPR